MCLTDRKELADKMNLLKNLAFKIPRFVHDEIGYNYRLTNIQSAIGCGQVENAKKLVDARRNVGLKYNKMLNYDEMLTGCNPIVAVATYTGLTSVKPLSL